jgi:hypothetical protein
MHKENFVNAIDKLEYRVIIGRVDRGTHVEYP